MKYFINYGTGAGNQFVEVESINEAMNIADDGCSHTQRNYCVEDEYGNELAYRPWYCCRTDVDLCEDPICIGEGFYGDWVELY